MYGYGVQVGVTQCAGSTCTHRTGCNVESSAVNARRQNVAITFTVTVDSATSSVTIANVQTSASSATASTLVSHIQSAATTTGQSIGSISIVNIDVPTTTQSQASLSSSSDDNTGVIVGAVVGGGVAFFVMKSKSEAMVNPTGPAETTQVVAMK